MHTPIYNMDPLLISCVALLLFSTLLLFSIVPPLFFLYFYCFFMCRCYHFWYSYYSCMWYCYFYSDIFLCLSLLLTSTMQKVAIFYLMPFRTTPPPTLNPFLKHMQNYNPTAVTATLQLSGTPWTQQTF